MSFLKMLKSNEPKIEPCRTPASTFPHSLKSYLSYNVEVACEAACH